MKLSRLPRQQPFAIAQMVRLVKSNAAAHSALAHSTFIAQSTALARPLLLVLLLTLASIAPSQAQSLDRATPVAIRGALVVKTVSYTHLTLPTNSRV